MRIRAAASRMRMKEIAIKSHPIKSKLLVYETQVRNLRKRLRRDPGANVLTPPHSTPPPCCCLASSRPRDAPNVSQEQTNARGSRTTRAPSSGHVPAGGRERGGSRGAASPAPAAPEGSAGGDGGFNFAAFVASMGEAPPAPAHAQGAWSAPAAMHRGAAPLGPGPRGEAGRAQGRCVRG